MHKMLPASLLLVILTSWAVHGAVIKDLAIAPILESDAMETADGSDFFVDCPVYPIETPQQVYAQGDWKTFADRDMQAKLRVAWNQESILFRIDLVDNVNVPIAEPAPGHLDGDYVTLSFSYSTVGVTREATTPWKLTLCPNAKQLTCPVMFEAADAGVRERLGDPQSVETKVFKEQEVTSILVKIPVANWEVPPRANSFIRFQAVYHDVDKPGKGADAKILTQFPVKRGAPDPVAVMSSYGEIRFVDRVWLSIRPTQILYPEAKIDLLIDYGNLSDAPLKLNLTVDPYKPGPTAKTFDAVLEMPAGETKQGVSQTVALEDLPSGEYRLKASAGLYYDSGQVIFSKPKGASLIYLPEYIEPQKQLNESDLPALSRETRAEVFRYLAGGGRVLWSAGQFDASSQEFRGILRPFDKVELKLPQATRSDVPWALFGGLDQLDGMGEPMVIDLDSSLVSDDNGFSPELPDFKYMVADRARKRLAVRSKRLLLLGFVYDYVDDESFPTIEVKNGPPARPRPLLRETLASSDKAAEGTRRTYVLRVWIEQPATADDLRISVENVAPFGPKAEVDFIALVGTGPRTTYDDKQAGLVFTGCDEADIFTRQLATSLFLAQHYLIDRTGRCFEGLPGGGRTLASSRDTGLLLDELSRWGDTEATHRMLTQLPGMLNDMRGTYRRTGALTMGHATLVSGIHQLWRRSLDGNSMLRRIWLPTVHLPVTDIMTEMSRNSMGLVAAEGEWGGVGPKGPASTVPMAQASQSALLAASEMASALGYSQSASTWRRGAENLQQATERYLQAPSGDLRVFSQEPYPASYGLPEQNGIVDTIPNKVWLFGRYADRSPMLYNGDLRVYDTPYLFSGLPFAMSRGMLLDDSTRTSTQTTINYLFIVSPLFQGDQLSFINGDLLNYCDNSVQLWTIMAAMMLDNSQIASRMLDSYVQYTFDEYLHLPSPPLQANVEVSPYTFEQKLNIRGQKPCLNLGASGNDLSAGQLALALRLARLLAGVDDTDMDNLVVAPRLPERWDKVEAKNWQVTHHFDGTNVSRISVTYERLVNDRYVLTVKSPQMIRQLTVRLGPFPAKVPRAEIAGGGTRERVTLSNENGQGWATKTFRNVTNLEIAVRPSM